MKREDPRKYSLQLTTFDAVSKYSEQHKISLRQASFFVFRNLKRIKKKNKVNCGFNLKTPSQFYSSLKRFKNSKMNHTKIAVSQYTSDFTGFYKKNNY